MSDYFDDFDGNFDDGDSMDDDSCEDDYDDGMGDCDMEHSEIVEPADEESVLDAGSNQVESEHEGFDVEDAFMVGGFIGMVYEEAREEAELEKEERKRENLDPIDPDEID